NYNESKLMEITSTLKETFDSQHEELAKKQKEELQGKYIFFGRQASGTDILFASVTLKDIANEIKNSFGIDVNYKRVHMDNLIKKIGTYEFSIDLSENISVNMFLSVARSLEVAQEVVRNIGN
ncbi:MAG: 50S ribosomal L9 C-terminal domain-containing protein, partial [Bacteroidota bacterium]